MRSNRFALFPVVMLLLLGMNNVYGAPPGEFFLTCFWHVSVSIRFIFLIRIHFCIIREYFLWYFAPNQWISHFDSIFFVELQFLHWIASFSGLPLIALRVPLLPVQIHSSKPPFNKCVFVRIERFAEKRRSIFFFINDKCSPAIGAQPILVVQQEKK